jgi:hypothetical protein
VIDKYKYDKIDNPVLFATFPAFSFFFEGDDTEHFLPEIVPFEKYKINNDTENLFIEAGIFGASTSRVYFPFLINLYNYFIDESDKIELQGYEDIGVKYHTTGHF